MAGVIRDSFGCEESINAIGSILLKCVILGKCFAKSPFNEYF